MYKISVKWIPNSKMYRFSDWMVTLVMSPFASLSAETHTQVMELECRFFFYVVICFNISCVNQTLTNTNIFLVLRVFSIIFVYKLANVFFFHLRILIWKHKTCMTGVFSHSKEEKKAPNTAPIFHKNVDR